MDSMTLEEAIKTEKEELDSMRMGISLMKVNSAGMEIYERGWEYRSLVLVAAEKWAAMEWYDSLCTNDKYHIWHDWDYGIKTADEIVVAYRKAQEDTK